MMPDESGILLFSPCQRAIWWRVFFCHLWHNMSILLLNDIRIQDAFAPFSRLYSFSPAYLTDQSLPATG